MNLGWGRKPEDQEETHANRGRTYRGECLKVESEELVDTELVAKSTKNDIQINNNVSNAVNYRLITAPKKCMTFYD